MKLFTALLLMASAPLMAQTAVSINLSKMAHEIKALHDKTPTTVKLRRFTAALAASASVGDIITTERGISRGYCEGNPFLVAKDGCGLNRKRFTILKAGLFVYLVVGEELAGKLPHRDIWNREAIVINSAAAIGYTTISIRNIRIAK